MRGTISSILLALILSLLCYSCSKSREKNDTGGGSDDSGSVDRTDTNSGSAEIRRESDSPLFTGETLRLDNRAIDRVDLLFVVDNSGSMEQEQAKLRDQIPRMIKVMSTGDKSPDDNIEVKDFIPVKSLHLAVVSSDLGLPGLGPEENPDTFGYCIGTGDDGSFLNNPSEAVASGLNCPASNADGYPIFFEHISADGEDETTTLQKAESTARAFECALVFGLDGCGFRMQLEAPLKALWPSRNANLSQVQQNLGISFVAGSQGRGDDAHRDFLRGTPYNQNEADRLSVLAIVLVTDREDCSAGANGDLQFLSLDFPGGDRQDLGLRCYKDTIDNWGNKYPVDRYINGFKALRPTRPDLVVFAAIAGIPADVIEDVNGDNEISALERDDFFVRVLSHEMMQEVPDPDANNLRYSCEHENPDTFQYDTRARPARRITEVAKGFGVNGVVRSICAETFAPAMDAIVDTIVNNLDGGCLPEALVRGSNGLVDCDVIWHMPEGQGCAQLYLDEPGSDRPQRDEAGRRLCVVDQIAVINADMPAPAEALASGKLGWYYDDFSSDMEDTCGPRDDITSKQRIGFVLSEAATDGSDKPPEGVLIDLECLHQIEI